MPEGMKEAEKRLTQVEIQDEIESHELSIAQKKAAEKAAKRAYGKDWKQILYGAGKAIKSVRMDREVASDLYGMGIGHEKELRDLSRPGSRSRYR